MAEKALAGARVIEYCHFVAGPYCAKLLADLGAEVVKIEEPGTGDEARRRGPFLNDVPHPERSGFFLYLNTNKLGITLNLRKAQGRRIFQDLIRDIDILVEDSPPRLARELGLEYPALKAINPRLIMASITPFGQTGPYRDYKAYYLNTFHSGGEGYLTPSGPDLDRPPLKVGKYAGEYECGISSALATLAALYWQRLSGQGQHIDVSKQHALMYLDPVNMNRYALDGVIPTRRTRGVRLVAFSPARMATCSSPFIRSMSGRAWLS